MNRIPTVHVVDDDDAVRSSLRLLLKSVGLPTVTYESARDFLAGYDADQPGCLVLDVRMPGMSGPELQEQVARYKPGDKISVTYDRNGKPNTVTVTLKNKSGNYEIVKQETALDNLGGELVTVDKETAKKNDISGGVMVKKIGNGILQRTRMQEGFVITSVDGQDVNSVEDLKAILGKSHGTVRLEGIYPGYDGTYGYPLNLDGSSEEGANNGNGNY